MKTFLRNLPLVIAIAFATACSGVATREPIDATVAGTYGAGDSAANAPVDPVLKPGEFGADLAASRPWWLAFGDERLNRLVRQVLAVNTDFASASLRLQRARASVDRAEADLWPRLDGSVSASASRALEGDGETSESYRANVGASWELDLWGRLRDQRDVARWEAEATAEDREATALSLVGQAAQLYWTLAFVNQRLAAGAENVTRLERTLQLVTVQFEAGAVSRIDLREAEQSLLSQRAALEALEQLRVETRNALTVLLDGQPWPNADEPQDLESVVSPSVQPGLPAELIGRRPDLRAAERRLRAERTDVDIARKSFYPSLSLTGSAGSSSTSLVDLLANPVATLGAALSLPFLDWSQMKFETEAARLDYEIAVNDFRKSLYTAFAEVDDALAAKQQWARRVELAEAALDAAAQIERLYEVRYRAGAVSLRIWLDAQQTRREAELALAETRREQLNNDVVLIMALGGTDVADAGAVAAPEN